MADPRGCRLAEGPVVHLPARHTISPRFMTDDTLSTPQALGRGSARRLAGQSALYGLAGALGKAVALLTVPILTRILTPAEYGLADLANAFAGVLAIVATFAGDIPAARLMGSATTAVGRRTILSSYVWASVAAGGRGLSGPPVLGAHRCRFVGGTREHRPGFAGDPSRAHRDGPGDDRHHPATGGTPAPFAVLATVDLLAQMILAVVFVALGWGPLGHGAWLRPGQR